MICKCGHDESQHGPAGYHRLCAYCLCNRFQPTEQAEDERLREALHKKLDRVLGFFNRHDPEEHRYVTEGGARAIVVGVLAALATQEPTAQKRTGRPVSSGGTTLDDLLREHCDAMKEHYGAMSIAYNAACEVREAATDYTPQWHERDESEGDGRGYVAGITKTEFPDEPPAVEQPEPMAYPDDITTRWLEYISSVKHTARAKGEKSPIHHLTSVESILQWWEEDIRPTLFTHPPVRKARDEPA